MTEFAWDPDSYLALMAEEIPDYRRLQAALTAAVAAHDRPPQALPEPLLLGIGASERLPAAAARPVAPDRTGLRRGRREDPRPPGPFDLVMSTLAIHHLDGPGRADLFTRIAEVLPAGGRFVL